MKIDKALKRQKLHKKIFFSSMLFLAVFLPVLTYLAYVKSIFMLVFLGVIETLIIVAVVIKINYYKLDFVCVNNRLKFRSGIFKSYTSIQCDKVAIVHTNKVCEYMEIIVVTTRKTKNKKSKALTRDFMKKHKELYDEYAKIKKIDDDSTYYFQVIKKGALSKYVLLEDIYRNCVNAVYTTSAIENIKIARGQNEI